MTALGWLCTLGYAGCLTVADLQEIVDWVPLDTIVDVRLQPFGRAPFDGPRASQRTIEAAGIAYRWDQRLGNLAYKTGGIQIKDLDAIEDVLAILRAGRNVALMCVCHLPDECHRLTLCEEAVRREPGLRVLHLVARGDVHRRPD